jgi:hypothetical protein
MTGTIIKILQRITEGKPSIPIIPATSEETGLKDRLRIPGLKSDVQIHFPFMSSWTILLAS